TARLQSRAPHEPPRLPAPGRIRATGGHGSGGAAGRRRTLIMLGPTNGGTSIDRCSAHYPTRRRKVTAGSRKFPVDKNLGLAYDLVSHDEFRKKNRAKR